MEFIYVLLALALAVGAYFLFFRKKEEPALPPREAAAPTQAKTKAEAALAKPAESLKAKPTDAERGRPAVPGEPQPEARPSRPAPPSRREAPAAKPTESAPLAAPKPRDVSGLRRGLAKSREAEGFFGRLRALFAGKKELSADLVAQIEDVLLTSDVGVDTTAVLLEHVKATLAKNELSDPEAVWAELRSQCLKILESSSGALELGAKPTVVLLVGVNGAGKTTTIGKLATKLNASGKKCVLAAGDTFRAAAVQQLVVWGERVGCEVVRGKDGADPGSVVFDAIKKAQEVGADVVLADTAGRLHTKSNLMSEMKKIAKTAEKALPGAPHEILLVVDSTNGQNAFAQAKEFKEALPLTGIVLTKLDGTAKGGVVLGVANGLRVPVRYVGLGERPDDLHEFSAEDFVEALLGREASDVH
jgi:fused signal recognition particle receptor